MPESMMMAKMALKFGIGIATRPATASAHSTAIITSSLAWGFLPSNAMKNGIISSMMMRVPVR